MNNYRVNPVHRIVRTGDRTAPADIQTVKRNVPQQPSVKFSDVLADKLSQNQPPAPVSREHNNVTEVPPSRLYINDDLTVSYPGIHSSADQGFFSYCVDDVNGECQEFNTLAEAKRFAKQHSKQNPDQEFNIYGMSSFYYRNGKQV